jgi:hypothetical protein
MKLNETDLLIEALAEVHAILEHFVEIFESDEKPQLADFNDVYEDACDALGREAKEL